MSAPLFVWLGAGRARRRGVADAGLVLLDRAAQAGLPVPAGAILLDEFFRFALEKSLAEWAGDRILIPDVELWHNTLLYSVRLPRFEQPILVRSAGQQAGALDLAARPVDFADPDAAARAVAAAWSSPGLFSAGRRDTLLLEQVPVEIAGTVTLHDGRTTDTVWLRGAEARGEAIELPRLAGWNRPDASLPAYARRLQQLLRGARRTFGQGEWRVAWGDDGRLCWLLGVNSAGIGSGSPA